MTGNEKVRGLGGVQGEGSGGTKGFLRGDTTSRGELDDRKRYATAGLYLLPYFRKLKGGGSVDREKMSMKS